MFGKKVSEKEIQEFRKSGERGIIVFDEKRIILPNELKNPQGPNNLHWDELGRLNKRDWYNGGMLTCFPGGFNGLFGSLLQELTERDLMSKGSPSIGDYFIIPFGGISVSFPDGFDPHGRRAFSDVSYFPKVKEDAEQYALHFKSDCLYPVYTSQIVSSPNGCIFKK